VIVFVTRARDDQAPEPTVINGYSTQGNWRVKWKKTGSATKNWRISLGLKQALGTRRQDDAAAKRSLSRLWERVGVRVNRKFTTLTFILSLLKEGEEALGSGEAGRESDGNCRIRVRH
jgi:hypothetical protein